MKRTTTISLVVVLMILAGVPTIGGAREIKARGRVQARHAFDFKVPPGEVLASVRVSAGSVVQVGDTLAVMESVDLQLRLNELRRQILDVRRTMSTAAEVEVARTQRRLEYERRRAALHRLLETSRQPEESAPVAADLALLEQTWNAANEREELDAELTERQLRMLRAAEALVLQKIARSAVISPIAGTVTAMTCQPGAQVADGGLMVVRSLDRLEVRCEVPQNAVRLVQTGQVAELTPDFMDDVRFTGRVVTTGLQGRINEEGFVFFPIMVAIDGDTGPLVPGMTVSVMMQVDGP